ncbi:MAG: bifunctional nuclease family protein [Myxococcota bacterium]|jgi:bifunctional DNase/RNase|nr:bifunctional nuclease family protein [Myxococcota bacterium]
MLIDVTVSALLIDSSTEQPVLLLQERGGERSMPIVIGLAEAGAIAAILEGIPFPRPMTHDLFRSTLHALDARVVRVVITALRDDTFYASLHLEGPSGPVQLDARPSDAIALALRFAATVHVEAALFEACCITPEAPAEDVAHAPIMTVPPGMDADELRKYLENLDTKEFGKYKV